MKTNKTYEVAVRQKYINDEKLNLLRPNLYRLTRANLRTICLNIIDETLSVEDEMVMKNYFKLKSGEVLRRKVEKYDVEGFRPIYNFLRGDTETIQSFDALELIAILIDFNPRPYKNYRISEPSNNTNKQSDNILVETNKSTLEIKNEKNINKSKQTNDLISESATLKKNLLENKVLFFSAIAILSILILIHVNRTRWMIWDNTNYIEVSFDTKKYNLNQLKLYKKERILNFKKIDNPDCNTQYFKSDGSENVWYGKNTNGELEYFTALGLHPKTAITLKRITKYMIKEHICEDYEK